MTNVLPEISFRASGQKQLTWPPPAPSRPRGISEHCHAVWQVPGLLLQCTATRTNLRIIITITSKAQILKKP